MSNTNNFLLRFLVTIVFSTLLIFAETDTNNTPDIKAYFLSKNSSGFYFPYLKVKDTIHFLGDEYIEIRLKEQKAHLIRRHDSEIVYRISTGNPYLEKGKSTPVGFYTVQTKSPVAISKQFDNAELFNWVGFNGNIGFHGLKKTGYYASLGIRPSSHGCVRIGKESGEDLYKRVKRGTPVIVFLEKPAIEINFADIREFNPSQDYLISNNPITNEKLFSRRINNLKTGLALRHNRGKLFLNGSVMLKPGGYEIGLENTLPNYQKKPLVTGEFMSFQRDNLQTVQIKPFIPDSLLSKVNKSGNVKKS